MKIRKGDKVKVLAGKDKGKTGKVLQVFVKRGRVSVEGVNLLFKNMRPKKQGEKGQVIPVPSPMDASNVKFLCPKCGKATRVGYKITDNKKFRICKKCQSEV